MRALALALGALATLGATAHAEERITDGTAHTLEPGEVRVGFLRSGLGLPAPKYIDGLEVSTYLIPWAAFLASSDEVGVQFVNGQLEASRRIAPSAIASVTLAALYGRVGDNDSNGRFFALPLEAHINRELHPRLAVGGFVQLTRVSLSGGTRSPAPDPEAMDEEPSRYSAEAAVRTNTAHLGGSVELRVAGWLSLVGEARVTRFGRISAEAAGSYDLDENTMIDVVGEASGSPPTWGGSVRVLTHLSLGWVNLRTGVSYGNYTLPMLNLAVPKRYVMPTLSLYLRI